MLAITISQFRTRSKPHTYILGVDRFLQSTFESGLLVECSNYSEPRQLVDQAYTYY
jgi:hypothetical protein